MGLRWRRTLSDGLLLAAGRKRNKPVTMPQPPQPGEYAPWQAAYISLVPESDIVAVLIDQTGLIETLAAAITPEQEAFRYAPGKWSVRQVFGHLADAERVFGYRALCIARGQTDPLPQFDENLFVETAEFDNRPVAELADELLLLRHANLSMLQPLPEVSWKRTCVVSGVVTSASAIAWVMAGHFRHHLAIFEDRYGISVT
jgi:hypothetical protein